MNLQMECTGDLPKPINGMTECDRSMSAGHFAVASSERFFRIADFRGSIGMGAVLVMSGLLHLALLWYFNAEWNGPLSPRKPALFGVSAGVTVWSIAWVLTKLNPWRYDRAFASLMAVCLLLEVGLITLQYWRGVPSHFNHQNRIDAAIETVMLGLILIVSLGIASLAWRSRRLPPIDETLAIAIRAGLWFLLASCGLGLFVTIAGEINIAHGRSSEIWGRAGVLKYPYGAALHAIQVLPLLSALLNWVRVPKAAWFLRSAVAAHILFMTHALWQTLHGRERLDVDLVGGILLAVAGLLVLLPIAAIAWRVVTINPKRNLISPER